MAVKEEIRLTAPNPPAPLQVVYLHQRDAGMIARYRTWANWLSEGRTRAVESELIAMDGVTLPSPLSCLGVRLAGTDL